MLWYLLYQILDGSWAQMSRHEYNTDYAPYNVCATLCPNDLLYYCMHGFLLLRICIMLKSNLSKAFDESKKQRAHEKANAWYAQLAIGGHNMCGR